MTAELRRDLGGVEGHAGVPLPAQRAPRIPSPPPAPDRSRWERRHTAGVVAVDLAAVVAAAALYRVWGGADGASVLVAGTAVTAVTVAALGVSRAWESSALGQGSLEFARLLRGFVGAAVLIALTGLALQLPQARPWVFAVLPVAGVLSVLGRLLLRRRLHRLRREGRAMTRVLAVGTQDAVAALVDRTRRALHHGWLVTGVCTSTGAGPDGSPTVDGVPVVGDLDAVAALAVGGGYDAVSVGQASGWTPRRLQQLAWDLEGSRIELVVDPGLMEIAGPRLHVANVDGLPLLRLTHPTFAGAPRLLKGAIDRLAALLILLLIWPLMLGLAVAVRRDGGPALFRQTRIGRDGRQFRLLKFRSMVVDAEQRLPGLQDRNDGAGLLFKMRDDPRTTPVGRVLRRFSLDELPQLVNVLTGSMSLVGPRPPLPQEVEGYERAAQRRLLVKPGITGLWQVSGRSDLSWEQSVRLDLRYVENWTLALDALILVKTVRAVLRGGGAY
jgi:exopolysaccharide biosynthesis polyprenyl glycosylphosphotransferase